MVFGKRLALFSLVFLGIACGSRKADHLVDAPPAVLPAGWTLAQDSDTGVSIGVASGWHEGTGALFDAQQGMSAMGDASGSDPNNSAAQMMAGLNASVQKDAQQQEDQAMAAERKKGVVISVVDSSRPTIGELRTRYYVKVTHHDSAWPLELAVQDEKDRLLHPVESDVSLPVGKAHRLETDNKLVNGDEQKQIVYVLADGNDSYAIRFISTNSPDVFNSIDQQVATTFRLAHKKS